MNLNVLGYKEGKEQEQRGVNLGFVKQRMELNLPVDPKIMTFDERKHLFEVLGKIKKDPKKTNFEYYILGPQARNF